MSTNQETIAFIEKYAPLAMEQQRKYGIPASITLAQAILETDCGKSTLAKEGNNLFGIKGSTKAIQEGKSVGYYSDDKPHEAFRHYNSIEESFEDHSRVLLLDRYKKYTSNLSVTDYKGWANAIKAGGYATDSGYVTNLINKVEKYNLSKYDTMQYVPQQQPSKQQQQLPFIEGHWSLPLAAYDGQKLVVTSDFGPRHVPGASSDHKGIDIAVSYMPVLATEDNGKVVKVVSGLKEKEDVSRHKGGNSVTIEYTRSDNLKYEVTYMHLSDVNVKVGDVVNGYNQIGISGNTGQSTGPHLHFQVREKRDSDEYKFIDAKQYLAEIAVRGSLNSTLVKNGKDLLADAKMNIAVENNLSSDRFQNIDNSQLFLAKATQSNNVSDWIKWLKEGDNDIGIGGNDIIADFVGLMIKGAMKLSTLYAAAEQQEQTKKNDNSNIINNTDISPETIIKRERESIKIDTARQLASVNYESIIAEQQQQNQSIKLS